MFGFQLQTNPLNDFETYTNMLPFSLKRSLYACIEKFLYTMFPKSEPKTWQTIIAVIMDVGLQPVSTSPELLTHNVLSCLRLLLGFYFQPCQIYLSQRKQQKEKEEEIRENTERDVKSLVLHQCGCWHWPLYKFCIVCLIYSSGSSSILMYSHNLPLPTSS